MKRFHIIISFLLCTLVCLTLFAGTSQASPADTLKEGYSTLNTEILNKLVVQQFRAKYSKEDVQVLEFFSYGCHWCNAIDLKVKKWLATKPHAAFHRLPIVFNSTWQLYGKAYYTAKQLNVLDSIHPALFNEIHNNKNVLNSEAKIAGFFASHGVEDKQFRKVFDSFDVSRQLKSSQMLAKAFSIRSVPSFVIITNTAIYETTAGMAGGEDEVFKVIEHLITLDNA